jgi:hypothetical protein
VGEGGLGVLKMSIEERLDEIEGRLTLLETARKLDHERISQMLLDLSVSGSAQATNRYVNDVMGTDYEGMKNLLLKAVRESGRPVTEIENRDDE